MVRSNKILIATVTCGAGHLQAANALEEAWKKYRPEDKVQKVDVLDFTPRLYKKIYSQGYIKLIEHAPELYSHYFTKTDDSKLIKKMTPLRRITSRWMARPFVKYVKRFSPDLVICPHFLPLEIMGSLQKDGLKNGIPKIICVVTDYEAHALWMEPCVDLYCVAAEETKGRLVARGIPQDRIVATGIPVSSKFSSPVNPKAIRKQMGLRDDIKTLLVLGGGFGMGPLPQIIRELDNLKGLVQILVVAGKNEKLRQALAAENYKKLVRVLGFATNMHELMAASDLIITKPGGLTTSEALAVGRPILVLNPVPGQESANSDFLLEKGAAIKINRLDDLSFRLEKLLKSQQLIDMQKSAKALGRPKAAIRICQHAVHSL